jgi:DNA primase
MNRPDILKRVAGFYAKTLLKDMAGLDFLSSCGLSDRATLDAFQVGYSNGSLHQTLPKTGQILENLKEIGILREDGSEFFSGCITVPLLNDQGEIVSLGGKRLEDGLDVILAGDRGTFHLPCEEEPFLYLVPTAFDVLALHQAGIKNVAAFLGSWEESPPILFKNVLKIFLIGNTEKFKKQLSPLVPEICLIPLEIPLSEFFKNHSLEEFFSLGSPSMAVAISAPESLSITPNGLTAVYGSRRYDLCAIEKPSPSRLRATIRAQHTKTEGDFAPFHVDTVDFYSSRSRRGFITECSRFFHADFSAIEEDVQRLLVHLEGQTLTNTKDILPILVSDVERETGEALGKNPDLVGEILRDLEKIGLIGETTNKLGAYLTMTSRKMDEPLSLQILSGSGAGKSHLQDAVLSLCPEEDLIKLTALTGQALFYKGADSLKNKVLALEEAHGAQNAEYAIRNLISSKKLVIESTVKNSVTGKLETQINVVNGPTAVFQTTTKPDTNAETKSRFIVTSVDESSEQTCAILEIQRNAHTIGGILRKKGRAAIVARHQAFQRLLKPLIVVNPFEPLLSFGESRLAERRDNPKYLNLILAVTFLYQMQRETKKHPEIGEYIETTLDDIAIANELAQTLFGQSLGELSRPSRTLLNLIFNHVVEKAAKQKLPPESIEFTRRELREALGWGEYQLRIHVQELAEFEYLIPLSGGKGKLFTYRLAWSGQGNGAYSLKTTAQVREEAALQGLTSLNIPTFVGTSCNPSHEVKRDANYSFPKSNKSSKAASCAVKQRK